MHFNYWKQNSASRSEPSSLHFDPTLLRRDVRVEHSSSSEPIPAAGIPKRSGFLPKLKQKFQTSVLNTKGKFSTFLDKKKSKSVDALTLVQSPSDAVFRSPASELTLTFPQTETPVQKSPDLNVKISLSEEGRVNIQGDNHSESLAIILNKTVAHDKARYQTIASSEDGCSHALLDKSGRLLALTRQNGAFTGITNSKIRQECNQKRSSLSSFHVIRKPSLRFIDDKSVSLNGETILFPDVPLNEYLTDTTSDQFKNRFRLHLKKSFQFDTKQNKWILISKPEDNIQHLTKQPSGDAWAVNNSRTLFSYTPLTESPTDLGSLEKAINHIGKGSPPATNAESVKIDFDKDIEHYSISKNYQAFIQTSNDSDKVQELFWLEDVRRPDEKLKIQLPENFTCRKTAILNSRLFIVDQTGNIHSSSLPSKDNPRLNTENSFSRDFSLKMMSKIAAQIGPDCKVHDIVNVEDDRMHLVVKDNRDRKHFLSVSLKADQIEIESAWNISDSITFDHQDGLKPFTPESHTVVDLGVLGKVTKYDERIYFFNEITQHWEIGHDDKSVRLKADVVKCGLDGKPWILKSSKLTRCKINRGTGKISENNHVFVLPQVKKTASLDKTLSGMDDEHELTDFAVMDQSNYLLLKNNGDLFLHTELSKQRLDSEIIRENMTRIKPDVNPGKIVSLAIDQEKSMWMVTESGYLYSSPLRDWRRGSFNELSLTPLPTDKTGKPVKLHSLHTTRPGQVTVLDEKGLAWNHSDQGWTLFEQSYVQAKASETDTVDDLKTDAKKNFIPSTKTTLNVDTNAGGMPMTAGDKITIPFRERMQAFVFRPTVEWPRALKNAVYSIQHQLEGREGLHPVYQTQGELLKALLSLDDLDIHTPLKPVSAQLSPLNGLANDQDEKALLNDVFDLMQLLSNSSHHFGQYIAKHYGFLDEGLKKYPISPKPKHTNSGYFNPASSRSSDLTAQLNAILNAYPIDEANRAGAIAALLFENNVIINHQKENVPLGLNRDKEDEIGLVKSRMVLDALMIKELHQIMNELVAVFRLPYEDRKASISEVSKKVQTLWFETWSQNPVKAVTDQGFHNHQTLEGTYDAIRQMTKAFNKRHHGVNITARSVFQANDQNVLSQKIHNTLIAMEPGENLSLDRTYGMSANASGYGGNGIFFSANARAGVDRGYQLSLTRTENGVSVTFGRDGVLSGNVTGGVSYNLMGEFDQTHKMYLDDKHHFPISVTGLTGVNVGLNGKKTRRNKITFELPEHELTGFLSQLANGNLNPLDILNKGSDHSLSVTSRQDFNLSLSAATLAYVTFPMLSDTVQNTTAIGRVSGGISASAKVVSTTRERTNAITSVGESRIKSDNKPQIFEQASISAEFTTPFGPRIQASQDLPILASYVRPSLSAEASIDNRTSHKISLAFRDAPKAKQHEVDKVMLMLEKAFTDNASSRLLASLREKNPLKRKVIAAARLKKLVEHFSAWYDGGSREAEMIGVGHKAAIRALQELQQQQAAFEASKQLITQAEYKTEYKNLSRLDTNSFITFIKHFFQTTKQTTQADRLKNILEQDHLLSSFINLIRTQPGTEATVTLELNTESRKQLEAEWIEGKADQQTVDALLLNPANTRLKSISFTRKSAKSDGFSSPSFLLAGSNDVSVSITENMGLMSFNYTDAPGDRIPSSYSLKGKIAYPDNEISQAVREALEAGFVLKTS